MFGTDAFTGAAAGAQVLVHDRQVIGTHGDGTERTRPGTGSQTEAPDRTNFRPTVQQGHRTAVVNTAVEEFEIGVLQPVRAPGQGDVRFPLDHLHPHDLCYLGSKIGSPRHARRRRRLPRGNGDGICAASGHPATSAIGPG